ncbi:MAG TPA: phytase, partial [Opitutus sp.]|nr:phytase [Opitutus sp.]
MTSSFPRTRLVVLLTLLLVWCGCDELARPAADAVKPRVITEPTRHDTDDPAIWVNPADPAKSLVLGTDKDTDGALYVYDLDGKIVKAVTGLARPNNVDVAYGFVLGEAKVDIAVVTERERQRLRVFRLPEMESIDGGDLVVFGGDVTRAPMGVALYRRSNDGALFVFVSGKSGPTDGYLAQYRLASDASGKLALTRVREFGRYS